MPCRLLHEIPAHVFRVEMAAGWQGRWSVFAILPAHSVPTCEWTSMTTVLCSVIFFCLPRLCVFLFLIRM